MAGPLGVGIVPANTSVIPSTWGVAAAAIAKLSASASAAFFALDWHDAYATATTAANKITFFIVKCFKLI